MSTQTIKGALWTARKIDQTYIVSIKNHSGIVEALTDFVNNQNIKAGQITGIGAVNEATLRFFDPSTKQYVDKTFKEQMEASNISGNISKIDRKPMLHLHITLGRRDYTALAGHLLDATISGAGEFFFYPLDADIIKTRDEEFGLNFYDL